MVRDVCLVVVTLTLVGMAGWLITSDFRQRRELARFQEKLVARIADAEWQAFPLPPEVEG